MHDIYREQPHDHTHGAGWSGMAPKPMTIGVGGPVGSGKTALVERLCKALRHTYSLAVVTNDIYTKEDAEFLCHRGALEAERVIGVETGGCPHSAIREDASVNLEAIVDLCHRFEDLQLVLVESGGDNLAATFSPELADLTIYIIDVAAGDKIPRKGAQVLPVPISWSSIKSIWRLTSARTYRLWNAMRARCAVADRSSSPICETKRACQLSSPGCATTSRHI